ncbi:hypothetical protein CHH83_25240 [Bacillus sp. 7586-K]|uniref:Proteins of 100 residues with WXG n=1 Tax=Metabacillus niabensis TaxID=324854 RepID=A0ABT9Z6T7_9BACI|nr:hypothetical protein [Metabacillus niabensis]MDQ0227328.1 hypothetical protein [Metabacillus niabensis]PAD66193.1 hypothetical protein CHH83_25240 [Bacillus sp. 7586-K]
MAKPDIKLDINELQAALNSLQSGIDDFKSYTTTFRDSTRDQLKSFNSDFIDKLDGVLDNMNDDINTSLLENLESIKKVGEKIIEEMQSADEQIGQKIKSGTS